MKWGNWFWKATAGVEDFVEGADDHEINSRRNYVYWTIDHASFQKWVVFVAGVGFFTDAYDIFALNVVIPILSIVYWEGKIPRSYDAALILSTLTGTAIGQVLFGYLADKYGRRKIYGLELSVVITSTLGTAMSSTGAKNSMNIMGWLIFWRLSMGIAIGADYPLSAVICSEFAPRKHRARMLASVFLCQPIGQLLGMLVSLVVMTISSDRLPRDSEICQTDECIRTVDSAWRSIVGFGSVPALVALFFRLTIPESPRYLLDVVGAVKSASEETQVYYGGDSFDNQSQEMMEAGRHFNDAFIEHQLPKYSSEGTPSASPTINRLSDGERHDPIRSPVLHVQVPLADVRAVVNPPSPAHTFGSEHLSHHPSRPVTIRAETLPPQPEPAEPAFWNDQQPPKASWQDAHDYFIKQKNWIYLVGTASTWFWLDFAFYGLGLSTRTIYSNIWHEPGDKNANSVYYKLFDHTTQSLVLTSIGTMLGCILIIKAIKYWSTKAIQFWGFIALTILFIILGATFGRLLNSDYSKIIIVLYVLCQLSFNLGPNTTTFIVPAEIFPTRYRCTSHGISAAAGKIGSIVGQAFIGYVTFPGLDRNDPSSSGLGWILMILAIFMAVGAVSTKYMVPETRDEKGHSRSLEVLAQGRKRLLELGRRPAEEDLAY